MHRRREGGKEEENWPRHCYYYNAHRRESHNNVLFITKKCEVGCSDHMEEEGPGVPQGCSGIQQLKYLQRTSCEQPLGYENANKPSWLPSVTWESQLTQESEQSSILNSPSHGARVAEHPEHVAPHSLPREGSFSLSLSPSPSVSPSPFSFSSLTLFLTSL